jgi:hypothetical protein
MSLADERNHMVLTMAIHLDVADEHELIVALHLVKGAVEVLCRVLMVASKLLL